MMQESSMYGGNLGSWSPDASFRFGDQDNGPKVSDVGSAESWESYSLPGSSDGILSEDALPLDMDDFSMDWMEECVQLDKLLGLADVSLLEDAAFQLVGSTLEDGLETPEEQLEDSDDPFQQLLQLRSMIDPDIINTPPLSPVNSQEHVLSTPDNFPAENIILDISYPFKNVNILQERASLFEETKVFLDSSKPIVKSEIFDESFVNEVEIIDSPPLSPQIVAEEVVPTLPDYIEDEHVFCVESSDYEVSLDHSGSTIAQPTPKTIKIVVKYDNSNDSDSSTSQASDSSDASYAPRKKSTQTRKRQNVNSSVGAGPAKRGRKPGPRKQTYKSKKERKRDQNKTAATRYRMKKRSEVDSLVKEEIVLTSRNKVLHANVEKLSSEISYLKDLLKEILLTKTARI